MTDYLIKYLIEKDEEAIVKYKDFTGCETKEDAVRRFNAFLNTSSGPSYPTSIVLIYEIKNRWATMELGE